MCLCVWMCCLCTSLTNTRETNTDRMTGQDVKRKSSLCSCAVAVGLRRLWASLSIITAHDPSVHRATWPESPDQAPTSSYICPTCHSGTQPCQRKFTACMNSNLNAPIPAQWSQENTVAIISTGLFVHMWSNMVKKHLFEPNQLSACQLPC